MKQRPHLWKTGPDPVLHEKYLAWLQQRNQALWRTERWELPFEAWVEIWGNNWENKGRLSHQMCMTRKDWYGDWTPDNVEIVTRKQHVTQQGRARSAGYRSEAVKRQFPTLPRAPRKPRSKHYDVK